MKSNNSLTLDLLSAETLEEKDADLAYKNSEAYRHQCEIDSIVRMYRERGGDRVKSYLLQVEKHRGSESAGRLRIAALDRLKLGKLDNRKQR